MREAKHVELAQSLHKSRDHYLFFWQEPPAVREAILFAELLFVRSRGEAAMKTQAWIPKQDKALIVSSNAE